ncbi:hypothetical protein [Sphingobacterium faecium]|uniref:hypothetical protein n=1 Tax=Sphingobacterium faecium TaxID=34087 RepID=UPI002469100B|nr:hypothetical protein [Sphingobacterium faecium]MDH5825853.1 hypothetical protein [Sphingobacterium faecium]
MPWYSYTGSDPADSSHYTLSSGTPSCQDPQEQLCAIQAADNGNNEPELNIPILSEMVQALQSEANTTNVRLKER